MDVRSKRILLLILAIGGLAYANQLDQPARLWGHMQPLHIALHEGFRGHTVTIRLDGKEIFKRSSVTTDLAISRADAFDVQVSSNLVGIEALAEPGGHKGSTQLDVTQYPFLSVSLEPDGSISFRPSKQFFRYM